MAEDTASETVDTPVAIAPEMTPEITPPPVWPRWSEDVAEGRRVFQ